MRVDARGPGSRRGIARDSPIPFGIVAVALLLLACLIAYGGTLRYGFVSDDLHLIVDRLPAYAESLPLGDAFTRSFWKGGAYGASPGEDKDYYRPLVTLSYALDARIWGGHPRGFHLTNILLHAVVSCLVLRLGLALGLGRGLALLAALLFAVHPVHAASVGWISGRTDLLCAVFLLLAYACLSRTMDGDAPRRGIVTAAGLLAYLLALLSKEMAASLVGLLALHGLLRRGRARRDGRPDGGFPWREIAAVAAVTIAYVLARASILGLPDFGAGSRSAEVPFRPGVLPSILIYYWRILLVPGALQLEVFLKPPGSLFDGRVIAGFLLLALQAGGAVLLLRRGHPAGLGLGWMLVSLLPVAHVVPLVFRALVTEYWAYIPSIGFVVALASGVAAACDLAVRRRSSRPAAAAIVLGALALIGLVRTPGRCAPLRTEEELHRNEVRIHPDRVSSWVSLASEYGSRGEIERAFQCIREAERRAPRERGVQLNLGNLYDARGEVDSAEAAYRREIANAPGSAEARVSLADLRLRKGDEEEASRLYREVLAQGGFAVERLTGRAEILRAASLAPGAPMPWPQREEGLRLAAGILTALHRGGARLDPERHLERIDLELRLGRIERARQALAEARDAGARQERLEPYRGLLDMIPGTPGSPVPASAIPLAREIADLYRTTSRTSLALPIWRGLLRCGGLSPEELNHVAVATMRGGAGAPPAPDDAERMWRMLLEEKPDHPLALLNLGGTGLAAGDRSRARAFWMRFLALYPDRPEAADVREKLGEL